jgi:hypothetical protein
VTLTMVLCIAVAAVVLPFRQAGWPPWANHFSAPVPVVTACLTVVAITSGWMPYQGSGLRALR